MNGLPDSGAPVGEKIQWLVDSSLDLRSDFQRLPCMKAGRCTVATDRNGFWRFADRNWRVFVFIAALLFGGKNTAAIAKTIFTAQAPMPAVEQPK